MKVIKARNVQQALPEALYQLRNEGVERESRNGPVRMFPEPVTTVYLRPAERVMFWPERDCNPFFHLVESLWMLAGRRDVEYVARYVERMRTYSDDGKVFHGAYGFRWRNFFFDDQLPKIIDVLKANPDDRRQVLSMAEAPTHPHNVARGTFVEIGGHIQPAPAPRYSGTVTAPPVASGKAGSDADALLTGLGFDTARIDALRASRAIG